MCERCAESLRSRNRQKQVLLFLYTYFSALFYVSQLETVQEIDLNRLVFIVSNRLKTFVSQQQRLNVNLKIVAFLQSEYLRCDLFDFVIDLLNSFDITVENFKVLSKPRTSCLVLNAQPLLRILQ